MKCACGSHLEFKDCCEPFLTEKSFPATAEQLMRSRYTAYTIGNIQYIQKTLAPESQSDLDMEATKEWATEAEWLGLKINSVEKGSASDTKGTVDFTATFKQEGKKLEHHEVSEFRKNNKGQWLFVSGDAHTHEEGHHHHHGPQIPIVRESPKIGRNDPCNCGSGKKYKKCHGANV